MDMNEPVTKYIYNWLRTNLSTAEFAYGVNGRHFEVAVSHHQGSMEQIIWTITLIDDNLVGRSQFRKHYTLTDREVDAIKNGKPDDFKERLERCLEELALEAQQEHVETYDERMFA